MKPGDKKKLQVKLHTEAQQQLKFFKKLSLQLQTVINMATYFNPKHLRVLSLLLWFIMANIHQNKSVINGVMNFLVLSRSSDLPPMSSTQI